MAGAVFDVGVRFTKSGDLDLPATRLKELANHAEKAEDHTKKISEYAGKISGGFNGVSAAAGGFNSMLDSIGGSLLHVGAAAATAITGGIVVGLEEGIKQGFKFNAMIEDLRISLAGMFAQTKGIGDMEGFSEKQMFGAGLRQADSVIGQMRRDAAELPGEFKDLAGIVSTIASPMLEMGKGLGGTEAFAANIMATAYMKGKIPFNVAGREVTSMLEGNARMQMPFFNRLGMKNDKGELMGVKEFNALSMEERYKKIAHAVDNKEAKEAYGKTWAGASSTAVDKARGAVGLVSQPLFESVKDKLVEFNNWATNNKGGLRGLGERLGEDLKNAFESTYNYLEKAYEHWQPITVKFAESLFTELESVWKRISKVMEPIMGKVESLMKDPEIFNKLESVVRVGVGLRAGGAVAGAGGKLASAGFGMLARNPEMLAGAAELGPAAIGAAVALAALSAAVYGIVDALADPANPWHSQMKNAMGDIATDGTKAATVFEELGTKLKPVANALGYGLLLGVDQGIKVFTGFAEVGGVLVDNTKTLASQLLWIGDFLNGRLDLMEKHGITGVKADSDQHDPIKRSYDLEGLVSLSHKVMDAHADPDKKSNSVPKTNVHIAKVEIKVISNQDPQRVAKSTAAIFADWARHPKTFSQGGSGVPTLTRPSF